MSIFGGRPFCVIFFLMLATLSLARHRRRGDVLRLKLTPLLFDINNLKGSGLSNGQTWEKDFASLHTPEQNGGKLIKNPREGLDETNDRNQMCNRHNRDCAMCVRQRHGILDQNEGACAYSIETGQCLDYRVLVVGRKGLIIAKKEESFNRQVVGSLAHHVSSDSIFETFEFGNLALLNENKLWNLKTLFGKELATYDCTLLEQIKTFIESQAAKLLQMRVDAVNDWTGMTEVNNNIIAKEKEFREKLDRIVNEFNQAVTAITMYNTRVGELKSIVTALHQKIESIPLLTPPTLENINGAAGEDADVISETFSLDALQHTEVWRKEQADFIVARPWRAKLAELKAYLEIGPEEGVENNNPFSVDTCNGGQQIENIVEVEGVPSVLGIGYTSRCRQTVKFYNLFQTGEFLMKANKLKVLVKVHSNICPLTMDPSTNRLESSAVYKNLQSFCAELLLPENAQIFLEPPGFF